MSEAIAVVPRPGFLDGTRRNPARWPARLAVYAIGCGAGSVLAALAFGLITGNWLAGLTHMPIDIVTAAAALELWRWRTLRADERRRLPEARAARFGLADGKRDAP